MTADFLLELLCEEIPARMQSGARNDLARLFAQELDAAGLKAEAIDVWSTPRRLALIARGLPGETQASREEVKGPRTSAPSQALEGFLRKTGLSREQLQQRDGVWFAVIEREGQATRDLLGPMVERIVRGFPWPKSMRWGDGSLRWVRPLHGIVAILGEDIVPVTVDGTASGAASVGHRFHHPGPITIGGPGDYAEKLRACHVIVDQDERERLIREGAARAAADAGLALAPDEGLVVENAGLTEWPVPLLGRFDPDFLDVPREVIVLTMRTNQKYFACTDDSGALAPAFVCVANVDSKDGGQAIVEGNRRVLAARLADARFFWEQDLKVPLERQAEKLSGIVFHEKLGTVADKVERVAKLARWLVEEGIVGTLSPAGRGQGEGAPASPSNAEPPHPNPLPDGERGQLAGLAERAARLAKADLVSGMVGEFPELQGVIGGYLARAQGEPAEVADAIRDHYKPVGQGDEVPTAPVTVAVALADKLDTVVGFFGIREKPTGSKDPFALRRAAVALVSIIEENGLRIHLREAILHARAALLSTLARKHPLIELSDNHDDDQTLHSPLSANRPWLGIGEVAVLRELPPPENHVERDGVVTDGYSTPYLFDSGEILVRIESVDQLVGSCMTFVYDRLEDRQRRTGARYDLIRAVLPKKFITFDLNPDALFGDKRPRMKGTDVMRIRQHVWDASDDPIGVMARVKALQDFVEGEDGADLLTAYKRAANILKKEKWVGPQVMSSPQEQGIPQTGEEDPLVLVEVPGMREAVAEMASGHAGADLPEEQALIAALDEVEPQASAAVEAEDFTAAMRALARLRGPIDAFFDHVTVNDPDPAKRERRLNLLLRFRDAVHRVADFSRIEG